MGGFAAYQESTVTTQSKGRLIVLLYEGAIKFMKQAVREIQAGDNQAKGIYINKALNIITELNAVLDMEAGGEIASNLRKLYTFMTQRLAEANIKRDPKMIEEVIRLMDELNQSWKALAN
jgi:flagellar secretion chaperone FliS